MEKMKDDKKKRPTMLFFSLLLLCTLSYYLYGHTFFYLSPPIHFSSLSSVSFLAFLLFYLPLHFFFSLFCVVSPCLWHPAEFVILRDGVTAVGRGCSRPNPVRFKIVSQTNPCTSVTTQGPPAAPTRTRERSRRNDGSIGGRNGLHEGILETFSCTLEFHRKPCARIKGSRAKRRRDMPSSGPTSAHARSLIRESR
ncbi:uncharacterized protein B0H64DRAFT_100020 [Chaetomium fimeti]|uniref:Transmembrane protein n=1 Tax=Chaetomium fimeti TaxID=1854472 RepID=A0AAE0HNG8_9PEZI|nr:hypothetical protein B0H64DRAFT_100020 [Chaetomium fimeti]